MRVLSAITICFLLTACSALSPRPQTVDDRLASFPLQGAPLEQAVTIRWNDHQVPFIEAETDHDLAVALGMVHAHLRGAQLRLLKQISQGRLSEVGGPPAREIDYALRILDFGYAVPGILDDMDRDTRAWLDAFVAGINHYQDHADRPPEYGLLGLRPEPYTVEDILTIGRLAGTEVNWLSFVSLLPQRLEPDWPEQWRRTLEAGGLGPVQDAALDDHDDDRRALAAILQTVSKTGSNSLAISAARSASGAPMIANDPHLGLTIPNIWMLAGMESPSYRMVGMMIPGIPFVALGRNEHLAWGGTNLRALTSDLYDVSALDPERIERRETELGTRFWFDDTRTIRRTALGPILSDSDLIVAREGEDIALRWVGHQPSQEIAAFLAANRARNGSEFRAAFADYAVSAQGLVFAARTGEIGKILATRLPRRPWLDQGPPPRLVLNAEDPAEQWDGYDTVLDLPWQLNPPRGFVASANDRPRFVGRTIGYFYGPDDRVDRLRTLAGDSGAIDLDMLKSLQRDVISEPAARLAAALAGRIERDIESGIESDGESNSESLAALAAWDGSYDEASRGAVVFELLLYHLAQQLYADDDGEVSRQFSDWGYLQRFLLRDLDAAAPSTLETAFLLADRDAESYPRWGDMHRLRVAHVLSNLPLIGDRFVLADYPVGGSRETLMKAAHGLVNERHRTTYGAQSRHISDLSDPDANYFVLLGGQDGWLGSDTLIDQVDLWRRGEYIQMPLSRAARPAAFPRTMTLTP